MARFCHELDIDLWDVIAAASTKPFGFQAFYPGPGVGGHCIPIDPNYLNYQVRAKLGYPFRFVELAQEINATMPDYVVQRVDELLTRDGIALDGARVLLLGVTYKANIADERESPAKPLAATLISRGAKVEFHDPHVASWTVEGQTLTRVDDLDTALSETDVVVLLQNHAAYDVPALVNRSVRFFDTRGVAPQDSRVEKL
jgi:nucleotide sugar dehydrogenase